MKITLAGAKPIEQLLNASTVAHHVMMETVDYRDFAIELRNDIAKRFNYPSLWAAIDRLIEFTEKQVRAEIEMKKHGYTYDDAFTLQSYYEDGDSND